MNTANGHISVSEFHFPQEETRLLEEMAEFWFGTRNVWEGFRAAYQVWEQGSDCGLLG